MPYYNIKENSMKVINRGTLKLGDIILTTSNAKLSDVIKLVTRSDISHAMLYVSAGSVMDATCDGVQARNIEKLFYPDDCAIHILRLKTPVSAETLEEIVNYVRSEAVMPYSAREAALSAKPLSIKSEGSRKQFCSRLVARAYARVGIKLHDTPDFCTPEDLKRSPLLTFVQNPSLAISDEEIERYELHGDTTVGMVEASNSLLKLARRVSSEVIGVEDITRLAIQHPELDRDFAQAYRNSGYLTYWQTEESRFPWRYDLEEMFALQERLEARNGIGSLVEYCRDTLDGDRQGSFKHWYLNAEVSGQMAVMYPGETTSLIAQLYLNLVNFHQRRISVVASWLGQAGIRVDAG